MQEFAQEEIAEEAYRLWEADGRPVFGREDEHWFRAIESLRGRHAAERRFGAGTAQ